MRYRAALHPEIFQGCKLIILIEKQSLIWRKSRNMVRKYLIDTKTSEKDKIKWRSHEPARIEAFSDAVFAFAVSLIIISLDVPKSSKELLLSMRGFLPF